MDTESKIFSPYRALGLVSNHIPLTIRYIQRRKENLIVTTVGNSFHTYGANKLGILSVSNPHVDPINSITSDAYHVYTASGNDIYAWRRGSELKHKYSGHKAAVHCMMSFGPHLIAVDKTNVLKVWDIKAESLYLDMEFPPKSFEISCISHPATYLNKILIGSKQGKLQIWNLKTNKLIYTFDGWNSPVVVLEQAPAPDVMAIGLADGRIILHNLKFDETVVEFKQDWGKVTGISFRTDGNPVMVTGSEQGHVALWDLKERRLSSQLRNAHRGPVNGIRCLPNEPLMVTSSVDNTLKMWIFDLPDGGARLLRLREGASKPPLMARFHGALGDTILTAGEDSVMRTFSTVTDILNKSLGQASWNRKAAKRKGVAQDTQKMPPITGFTSEVAQEQSWDNLAAIHRYLPDVTTWSISQQKMGENRLIHDRFKTKDMKRVVATCLELTMCGNYIIIGYSSGHMDKYNIQSSIFRGTFGNPTAHSDAVRGVVTDGLNQFVVSGGQEGELRFWRMKDNKGVKKLPLDSGIAKMILHRESNLLAVALDDWSAQVIDIDTKNIVRKLYGHSNQITDIAFSHDSRWLVSSSLDKTIRIWDLPSGTCIDQFNIPSPTSSLTMSPVGDFLATTHTGHLGVYLWANKSCFTHVSLRPLPEDFEAPLIPLPSMAADASQMPPKEGEEAHEEKIEENIDDDEEYKSPEQISEELITLANLPTSRWLNLLSLDVIKKKNKPVEPPKVPKAAPFFIPTVPGLEFKLAAPEEESSKDGGGSKIRSIDSFEMLTQFGKLLKAAESGKDYEPALKLLMSMGPAAVEVEIRGLDPDIGGSEDIMIRFIEMIKYAFQTKRNFEVTQGYLGLFLKLHADFIMENDDAKQVFEKLSIIQEDSWHKLRDTMNQTLTLVSYFKNAALINY